MASSELTLLTRSDITSAETPATGRKLFTLDGDTFELGSTGLRDLSGLLVMTWIDAGRLLACRTGERTQLHIVDLILKAGAPPSVTILQNDRTNTGTFKPAYPVTGRAVAAEGNMSGVTGPSADVTVNAAFGVVVHGATPGQKYQASLSWESFTGWASALPGVADGQPIGA